MKRINLPFISDRYIGFTIPEGGTYYICDHDAVWLITLAPELIVHETDINPYNFVEGRRDFLGLVFDGLEANAPLLRVGQNTIAYVFDPEADKVVVKYVVAGQGGEIEFPIFSQYWFSASFSDDGRHLILAEPDSIAIYETT
ncbi:hypothetical protein [Bradyrhizobium sp. USDA 4454]